jgi:plastocyanin
MKKYLAIAFLIPTFVFASENEFTISIKDHKFEPAEVAIPAGKKIKLMIENKDVTPEEFESYELNREKVVAGNSSITVYIGPLAAGRYPYFGDFNQATAQGIIIVK